MNVSRWSPTQTLSANPQMGLTGSLPVPTLLGQMNRPCSHPSLPKLHSKTPPHASIDKPACFFCPENPAIIHVFHLINSPLFPLCQNHHWCLSSWLGHDGAAWIHGQSSAVQVHEDETCRCLHCMVFYRIVFYYCCVLKVVHYSVRTVHLLQCKYENESCSPT